MGHIEGASSPSAKRTMRLSACVALRKLACRGCDARGAAEPRGRLARVCGLFCEAPDGVGHVGGHSNEDFKLISLSHSIYRVAPLLRVWTPLETLERSPGRASLERRVRPHDPRFPPRRWTGTTAGKRPSPKSFGRWRGSTRSRPRRRRSSRRSGAATPSRRTRCRGSRCRGRRRGQGSKRVRNSQL